jgi:hypothetical protein
MDRNSKSQETSGIVYKWYSWDSPIGLSVFLGVLLISVGLLVYLLHLANVIK